MVAAGIKAARFPVVKSLDSFDFKSLNKTLVLELARCEYIERRENLIALGQQRLPARPTSIGLGLAAARRASRSGFITAAALASSCEARDDKQLLRLQKKRHLQLSSASCRCPRPEPNSCSRCSANDRRCSGPSDSHRLTHHVKCYRLNQSRRRRRPPAFSRLRA